MTITGAIRGTSKEKLYLGLGLESLQLQRSYRELVMFYKIYKTKSPQYLFKLIPEKTHAYPTRNVDNIPLFKIRHIFFKNFSLPSTIIESNNLDPTLWDSKIFVVFKNSMLILLDFPQVMFLIVIIITVLDGIITRLRVGMGHLRERKFKQKFQDI